MSKTHNDQRFAPIVGLSCLFSCLPFAQAATDCTAVTQIPQSECEALVDLYNSTDGSNWKNHTGWNETDAPCDWFGVSCSGGYVIRLSLQNKQLHGSILESLGNLSNLQRLYLQNNQLSGSIPESLGSLSNLQILSLSSNQLSGSIPELLGNLSNLQRLYLQNNELSGSIPTSLGNLSNLQVLHLYNNELCGDIPPSLMNLSNISSFSINNNHLTASDPALIEWLNSKEPGWESTQTVSPEYCRANLVKLDSFIATPHSKNVTLDWTTGTEKDNAGFFLWRGAVDDNGGQTKITALEALNSHQMECVEGKLIAVDEPSQLITAIGNSREGACYSFEDTSINKDGTYYYVLEDVDTSGKRTVHCKDMDAVTIGKGSAIDLKSAKRFCRQTTGSTE
jgi:hypothetical protein